MGQPPTANQLLKAAQGAGIIPADAAIVPRKGAAEWRARGLGHTAYVSRNRWWNRITVQVFVVDPVFGPPVEAGGVGACVEIRPAGCDIRPDAVQRTQFHEFAWGARKSLKEVPALMARDAWHWEHRLERPWPEGKPGPDDLEFLRATLGSAGEFVRDRVDLCELLMREDEIHRGSLWVQQRGFPARVIDALLIARDLADERLEAAALAILRSDRMIPVDGQTDEPIRVAVARWLRQYRKWSGLAIEL